MHLRVLVETPERPVSSTATTAAPLTCTQPVSENDCDVVVAVVPSCEMTSVVSWLPPVPEEGRHVPKVVTSWEAKTPRQLGELAYVVRVR